MISGFVYRVTLRGVDLTPASLSDTLRDRIVQTSLRGSRSRTGSVFPDTTIVANVDSIAEGIAAIAHARAVRPALIDDAELNIEYEYVAQCNLELSIEEIAALSRAGGALTISCWEAPAARENRAVPAATWKALADLETTPLWPGTVFRFPATWPYEAFVDYMLVSDQASQGDTLKLLATTGHKGGSMNVATVFPHEAYVSGTIAIESNWLKANWREWVYDACAMDAVHVSQGYAAPVDAAGNLTL